MRDVARRLLAAVTVAMPASRHVWGTVIIAELDHVHARRDRAI